MSAIPKSRWYQFRLRTLLGVITLVALATGIVQHVRQVNRRILYHEGALAWREAQRRELDVHEKMLEMSKLEIHREILPSVELEIAATDKVISYHRRQIELYEQARWRPWIRVAEEHGREEVNVP